MLKAVERRVQEPRVVAQRSSPFTMQANSQRGLYWNWMICLGDACGFSADQMHEFVARAFLGQGMLTVGQFDTPRARMLSGLDPIEFADLLQNIYDWADSVFGITLFWPDDVKIRAVWDALSEHEQRRLSKKHGLAPSWAQV